MQTTDFEVVVIGGGPAGLSAALVAGRARRRAALVDGGIPRNAAAPAIRTFVSRDGILPAEFRKLAREQIAEYPSVSFFSGLVTALGGEDGDFLVSLEDGTVLKARKVILAVGLIDKLPEIPGVRESWGAGVHHCVFCDGYEHRDGALGLLVEDPSLLPHVALFRGWSENLTVFTNGAVFEPAALDSLAASGIAIETGRIEQVIPDGSGHSLREIRLSRGRVIPIKSFWIRPQQSQTPLVESLGLAMREDGAVARDEAGVSSRSGIYVAGDISAGPAQQAILAAADGAKAGYGIARELLLNH